MKVLWVTNSILPDLASALKIKHRPFEGWLIHLSQELSNNNNNNIELIVATTQRNMGTYNITKNGITYYLLETKKKQTSYDKSLEEQWKKVIENNNPDIIHLQGSENAPALALINSHPNRRYVLSLQGIISVYARYYKAGITSTEILRNLTIRTLIKGDSILSEEKWFYKRGNKIEKQYFNKVKHFIGRTSWDKAHTKYLSSNGKYHYCNEMLRMSFYEETPWDYNKCNKNTVFISQGNYPIKGLHQVLKAIALLKPDFPDITLCFAGRDILTTKRDLMSQIKEKNYDRYLKNLIKKLDVSQNVKYLGTLNEKEMIKAYKEANVFVCPSSIENSPNSLAEAQILGVPCIASYVGGIPSMVENKKTGLLYRFEEVEQLAEHIRFLFSTPEKAINIGKRGRESAIARHVKNTIVDTTISIYNRIIFGV